MTNPLPQTNLPQTGFISANTLAKALEVSPCTIWGWSKSGRLPKPKKLGANTSRFNAGEVRETLAKLSA